MLAFENDHPVLRLTHAGVQVFGLGIVFRGDYWSFIGKFSVDSQMIVVDSGGSPGGSPFILCSIIRGKISYLQVAGEIQFQTI